MTLSFGSSKRHFWAAIALLSVLVVALIVAVVVLAVPKPEKKTIKDTANYCFKSHCLLAASEILESINSSVNPCDDFYEHSCGTWIKSHRISPDQDRIGTFNNVRRIVNSRLIDLLQESSTDNEPTAIQKAKIFFRSCMDLKSIEAKSEHIISDSILQMKNVSDYVDLVTLLIDVSANVLVPAYVGPAPKNVSHNIITVTRIPLILWSKSYYNKSTAVFTAFRNMIDGFSDVLMGNYTDNIIDLEWDLKDIYPDMVQNSSELYNLMTVEELHNLTQDQVNWIEIFKKAVNNSGSRAQVDENTNVLVYFPNYIKELADILNATDLNTLISYATSRYIMKHMNAMPVKYRDLDQLLRKAMLLTKVPPSREKLCAITVRKLMPHATGRLYVDRYFPASSKKQAVELVVSLRNALEKMFKETKWMDDETRAAAIEKVESVLPFIGYDDSIKDNNILNRNYRSINFTENDFMLNVIRIDHLIGHYAFYLESINNRSRWGARSSAVVNAFYSPQQNAIFFPAGILQAPFYDAQYPLSMLFGAMGAVVGHEFTHGFDNYGAQFDKVGNLKNWWTDRSMENFKSRAAGLKKQYSDFPICKLPKCNLQINENKTLGENIADNGGVKAAFKAYKEYIKRHKTKTRVLPGLSYTSDQLFFIGYAHIWCRKIQPNALINQLLTDPHSPANARVIVTLRNSEAFSTAFKCKENSPMNPAIKYGVW